MCCEWEGTLGISLDFSRLLQTYKTRLLTNASYDAWDFKGFLIYNIFYFQGCSQISLAEFDYSQEIGLKWYNLLGSFANDSHTLQRSDSSASLEAIQQRFHMLPSLLVNAEGLNEYDSRLRSNSYREHVSDVRDRSNSNEERGSVNSNGSQTNLASNSLCNSTERIQRYTPPRLSSAMLQHIRSRSDEREEQIADINVGRSSSDCTGCRRSLRAPFIRMGVGRRSIRQNRLAELKSQKLSPALPPVKQKRDPSTGQSNTPMTSLDLEMELQAAYSKQVRLFRLNHDGYCGSGVCSLAEGFREVVSQPSICRVLWGGVLCLV